MTTLNLRTLKLRSGEQFVDEREIQLEPLPPIKGGEPLSPLALVARPAEIKGVQSWTIETRNPRGQLLTVAYSPDGRWLAFSSDRDPTRTACPNTTTPGPGPFVTPQYTLLSTWCTPTAPRCAA